MIIMTGLKRNDPSHHPFSPTFQFPGRRSAEREPQRWPSALPEAGRVRPDVGFHSGELTD